MPQIQTLDIDSTDYPEDLKHIASPPKTLYFIGDLPKLLYQPRLTVVGSRRPTPYGISVTRTLVHHVASHGVVIISGLALGVDAISHNTTLSCGGLTIAVLPCGLDRIYPSSHKLLATKIFESGGALVSEYPESTPPLKQHFIARNRIVSALGQGVLITEAAAKSGTLHTASFALEQGRTVMAVPGNITNELSAGTNNLIKAGALPVTEAADIYAYIGLELIQGGKNDIIASTSEEESVLRQLKRGVTDTSQLLALSKLETAQFNRTLTMLEINGKIRSIGGGQWSIC